MNISAAEFNIKYNWLLKQINNNDFLNSYRFDFSYPNLFKQYTCKWQRDDNECSSYHTYFDLGKSLDGGYFMLDVQDYSLTNILLFSKVIKKDNNRRIQPLEIFYNQYSLINKERKTYFINFYFEEV